ncbi:MAG: ABC transporter permease [Chloroflexi bacterium]|nr:ABC transporter permease [Chloroflexota bacterium]
MKSWVGRVLLLLAPVLLTLAFATIILLMVGADPLAAYGNMLGGSLGNVRKLGDVVIVMVPLTLCAAGMLITFAAGLWNIGVEGQIVAGALMTTWLIQSWAAPSFLLLPATLLAGALGGALWGVLIGTLRTWGRVNEIFAGLGLNFVAMALTNYLIFGPWKPPDGATMSGTDPFPPQAWMPLFPGTRLSPVSLGMATLALICAALVLGNTYWGLELKALGLNPRAAERMGIDTRRQMLLAFVTCGVMAGIAGSLQSTAVYRRLIPQISGGYGYLSQLVVLLSGLRAGWVPAITFFFGVVQIGSPRLELRMQLDSSLGGVLQAGMVLAFLLVRGVQARIAARRRARE